MQFAKDFYPTKCSIVKLHAGNKVPPSLYSTTTEYWINVSFNIHMRIMFILKDLEFCDYLKAGEGQIEFEYEEMSLILTM